MTPFLLGNERVGIVHVTERHDIVFIPKSQIGWDWSCGVTAPGHLLLILSFLLLVSFLSLPAAARIACRRVSRWGIGIFLKLCARGTLIRVSLTVLCRGGAWSILLCCVLRLWVYQIACGAPSFFSPGWLEGLRGHENCCRCFQTRAHTCV